MKIVRHTLRTFSEVTDVDRKINPSRSPIPTAHPSSNKEIEKMNKIRKEEVNNDKEFWSHVS